MSTYSSITDLNAGLLARLEGNLDAADAADAVNGYMRCKMRQRSLARLLFPITCDDALAAKTCERDYWDSRSAKERWKEREHQRRHARYHGLRWPPPPSAADEIIAEVAAIMALVCAIAEKRESLVAELRSSLDQEGDHGDPLIIEDYLAAYSRYQASAHTITEK